MIGIGQPGHIDQIKQANVGAVYRLIDTYGPVSRIALSKYAHLAPASITKIVRELMKAHLVGETEYQENGLRGRPLAWWWRRRPGIFSRCTSVTAVSRCRCVNCPANWWWKDTVSLPSQASLPLLTWLIAEVDEFFTRHQRQLERLTAIAVTVPGIIDAQAGIIHRMPWYDVCDMPLGDVLSSHIGVPVYLQHDICAWTMAEALYGAAHGCNDVVQIVIDHNVGAGGDRPYANRPRR